MEEIVKAIINWKRRPKPPFDWRDFPSHNWMEGTIKASNLMEETVKPSIWWKRQPEIVKASNSMEEIVLATITWKRQWKPLSGGRDNQSHCSVEETVKALFGGRAIVWKIWSFCRIIVLHQITHRLCRNVTIQPISPSLFCSPSLTLMSFCHIFCSHSVLQVPLSSSCLHSLTWFLDMLYKRFPPFSAPFLLHLGTPGPPFISNDCYKTTNSQSNPQIALYSHQSDERSR